jgi:uncharacterized protein (DUF58 family)
LSSRAGILPPPGRQGPGPIASPVVEMLDLVVARRASGVLPGERRAPGAGSGTELATLRPYQVGDDVRQLDPAATARTGVPHVRLQVPERLLTTWLLLDLSASMAFGTAQRLKSDVAEGVAIVLGRLATRRGGRVAAMTCGTPAPRMLKPRGGRGAVVGLRRLLSEGVAVDGAPQVVSLDDALRRMMRVARQPGLIVVVSDFRGPIDWGRSLRSLGIRHSLFAVEVHDPREVALPAVGRLSLVDPESGAQVEVDTSDSVLRERYAAVEQERRDKVAAALKGAQAEHVVLSTQGNWLKELGRTLR